MDPQGISALWLRAVEEYKARLTPEDLKVVLSLTDPQELLWRLQNSDSQSFKAPSRLQRIETGIEKYGVFLSMFSAAIPETSTLLWGSIDLVHQMSSGAHISSQLSELVAALVDDICSAAPRLRTYERLFEGMDNVNTALANLYQAVLECIYEVNEHLKRNASRSRLRSIPEPYQVQAKMKIIQQLKEEVEKEAWVANVDLHYKWHEEIRNTLSLVTVKPKGSLPCRIVPYPVNTRFVGRADILGQMKVDLVISKPEQKSIAIHGMGGVGKTQIALKYIYDHLDQYPAVFWMKADSTPKLQASFVEAAKRLELEDPNSQRDGESVTKALKEWMEEAKDEWLVVFDNADDLDVLKPFWPAGNRGTIIITSRNPSSVSLTKAGALVKPLSVKDGEQLFMSIVMQPGNAVDEENEGEWIRKVIEKLGYLPLAINQVAHYMVQNGCSVDDFYEIYNESLKSSETFGPLKPDTADLFYEHSLATVWKISLKKLSDNATSLLKILSCLDPDGVPEDLLRKGSKRFAHLRYLSSTISFVDAVGELMRNGLISKNLTKTEAGGFALSKKATRSLVVHRLVQETVFHQQEAASQSATFSDAVDLCLELFPHPTRTNFRLMHRWPECEQLLPHLLALNSKTLDSDTLAPDGRLAELFLYGSWYLYERRMPELALPLLATAKAICDDPASLVDWFFRSRILSCFGCILFECSRYAESESFFRQALDIRLLNVAADDVLLAHGYQDVALPITAQARYDEAVVLQKKGLAVAELNSDDFTRRDMRFHINHNMARTLEAAGQPEKALPLHFEQGDEFGNGLRQEQSESGAVNLYAIGNCYLARNDRTGIDYHTRSLKIRKSIVGDKGFYYGVSLHKLGRILLDSANWTEAEDALQQARDIFADSLEAQRELARSTYYLSLVKKRLGDMKQAAALMDEAKRLRVEITGEKPVDPETNDRFDQLVIYIHR